MRMNEFALLSREQWLSSQQIWLCYKTRVHFEWESGKPEVMQWSLKYLILIGRCVDGTTRLTWPGQAMAMIYLRDLKSHGHESCGAFKFLGIDADTFTFDPLRMCANLDNVNEHNQSVFAPTGLWLWICVNENKVRDFFALSASKKLVIFNELYKLLLVGWLPLHT